MRNLALLASLVACGPTYVVQDGHVGLVATDIGQLPDARVYADNFGDGLVRAVADNPAAAERARGYRDRTRRGWWLTLLGLGCDAADLAYAAANTNMGADPKGVGVTAEGVLLVCSAVGLVGAYYALSAPRYQADAITIYNNYPAPGQRPQLPGTANAQRDDSGETLHMR
jgi:hypothetical protein